MRKKLLFIIIILLLTLGAFSYRLKIKSWFYDLQKPSLPPAQTYQPLAESDPTTTAVVTNPTATPPIIIEEIVPETPKEYNLAVPFTSQAPKADWSETFNEACEEASIIMVDHFYQNTPLNKEIATAEILQSIDWQVKNWGGHHDLTAAQTKQLIEDYFGYKQVKILANPTVKQIKAEIIKGHPVIVPAAGRLLGNPNFRRPGPVYHMLVIKGFTKDQFITNDPGTRKGADYLYDFATILNANHSWNEADITKGEKQMVIME